MKLLVLILNKTELLDKLTSKMAEAKLGATIIESRGAMQELFRSKTFEDIGIIGSLREVLNTEREENRTVITVISDERVQEAVSLIESVTGDLNKPDTGVVFTLPVDYYKGIGVK